MVMEIITRAKCGLLAVTMVMEIMTRVKCGLLAVPSTVPVYTMCYPYTLRGPSLSQQPSQTKPCIDQFMLGLHNQHLSLLQLIVTCRNNAVNIVTRSSYMDFAMAMHALLQDNMKGVFPTEGFSLRTYFHISTRQ
jgi:hypothetical protein